MTRIVFALSACTLFACAGATVDYEPPVAPAREFAREVDRPRAEIWAALTEYVKDLDFLTQLNEPAIGRFEGSFIASDIPRLIDCGQFRLEGDIGFDGSAAQYIQQHGNGTMRVELFVRGTDAGDGKTLISIKARYSITGKATTGEVKPGTYGMTFGTGESDTLQVKDVSRTCQPTYVLEEQVLDIASGKLGR